MSNFLFSSQKDWKNNACIDHVHAEMAVYIDGYKTAADILSNNVIDNGRNQDILVYPISFLYRQYIELQLKYLIREGRALLLTDEQNFPHGHNIQSLWKIADHLLNEIIGSVDPSVAEYITGEEIIFTKEIINYYSETDPDSLAFRYAEDKKGNNTMNGITHINIRNLSEKIGDLSVILKKYELVVDVLRQQASEMG